MKVILNPPYTTNANTNRDLHLQVLEKVIEVYPNAEIVNLSPTRWLKDPLAKVKKHSDFNKHGNIIKHLETLEEISKEESKVSFDAEFLFNIGIYHLTENGGYVINDENKILNKFLEKGKYGIPYLTVGKQTKKTFVLINRYHDPNKEVTFDYIKNEKLFGRYYVDGVSDNGMTLAENKDRSKRKIKSDISKWWCVEFDTKEEAENFYYFTKTKFFRYIYKSEKLPVDSWPTYLPYLSDYTRPWTDEDLYQYFELTDEEIKEIEESF